MAPCRRDTPFTMLVGVAIADSALRGGLASRISVATLAVFGLFLPATIFAPFAESYAQNKVWGLGAVQGQACAAVSGESPVLTRSHAVIGALRPQCERRHDKQPVPVDIGGDPSVHKRVYEQCDHCG